MTFAHPFALLLGPLAAAVLVLYRLRPRLDREPVEMAAIWRQVLAEEPARIGWLPRRQAVSLTVQLLVLLLAVLALAEPQIPPPRQIVLIVDNWAGMNASDVEPSRLAAAKKLGQRWIRSLHAYDSMAILSAGRTPTVHCTLSRQRAVLEQALDAVPTTDGPCRMAETVQLARTMLDAAGRAKIVVLSDACSSTAAAIQAAGGSEGAPVELVRIGTPLGNTAISRFVARPTAADPRVYQVLVEARNFAAKKADCQLSVAVDGKRLDRLSIGLDAEGRWSQVFELRLPAGGQLTARLDPPDAYPADNQAAMRIPPAAVWPVVLATNTDAQLHDALAADPHLELIDAPKAAGPGAVRVFEGRVPDVLPAGPLLVVNPAGECDLWKLGPAVSDPTVARQADDSPLLANVRLLDAYLPEARRLELTAAGRAAGRPLAWSSDGAALAFALERPQGRVFILCGNPAASNLAREPAFPVLVANAMAWLAGGTRGDSGIASGTHGDTGIASGTQGESLALQPLGLDLRSPTDVGISADTVDPGRPGCPVTVYLLGLILVLLAVEWCLYQRRWMT
ncbi:MAG: VWA domain-containing protein [Thermoguttaceae bacterium]|jgi:hypothetical protein